MVIPLVDEQEEDIVTEQEVEASPSPAPPSGEEQEVVQELEVVKEIEVTKEQELMEKSGDVVKVQEEAMQVLEQSPQPEVHKVVFSGGEVEVPVGGAGGEVEVEVGQEYQEVQVATTEGYQVQDAMVAEDTSSMPSNAIQIIDQNGQKIVIVNGGGLGTTDESDLDTDAEDREFTGIEAESIEDILAQFESESAPRSVACPNCRKCFVSAHFLNLHISNHSTMCDLCNTQCCSQVNLRNHKNLECDLSKRKRNIDLIAQETAILGRKPIESDEETGEEDVSPAPSPAKKLRSINDAKYECGLCGRYVKILDSHMKFVHGSEGGGRGAKYR